jgi:hypothetical protein
MKLRDAAAHSMTDHRGDRVPRRFRDGCGLGEQPDLSVLHDPYPKPSLGCVLERQRSSSVRCDAGRLARLNEEP